MKKKYFLIVLKIFICKFLIGQTELELIVPSSHSGFLKGLELDYSQKYLFTISTSDIKMWEVESKNKIKTFKGFNNILCSPNGEFFVIHNYTNIEIYHYRNFTNPIKLIFEKGISSVSFFSNSKKESERLCVLDSDGNLYKINTSNGNTLESIQIKKFWFGDLRTEADYDSLLLLSPDTVKFLVRKETGEIVGSKRYRQNLILSDSLLYRIEKKWGAENHKIIYRDSELDLLKLANINFDNILFEGVEFGPTYNGEVSLLIRFSDSSLLLTMKGGIVTSRTELPQLGEFKGKYKFSFDGRYLVYFCFQKGEKLDVSVVFDISTRKIISEIEETGLFNFSINNKNILYNSKNKLVISPLDQGESTVINFVEDWWGNCFDSKMDFALSSQNASNSKRKKTEYYSWNFRNPREIERMEVASNFYFGFQGAFNAPLFISDSMLINLETDGPLSLRGLQVYNRFNGKTREVFNNSIDEGLSHLDVNKNYFFSSKSEFENYLYILNLNEKLDRKIPFTWKAGDVTKYWAYLNEEELLKKKRHNVVLLFDSISCSFFDVNSFQLLNKFIESEVVYSWHYNGGNFLEYSKEDSTFIWDIATKRKILGIENDKNYSLNPKFSKNNEMFLYRKKNFLHVFDLNSRNEILKLDLMSDGLGIKVDDYIEFELHGNFLVIDIKPRSILIIYDIDKRILKFKYSNFEYQDFDISDDLKYLLINESRQEAAIYSIDGKRLYTRCQFGGGDWLVYDEHYRFDGTPGAIEKLYFTCGLEVIDLAQMKDSLWVPGLVEKIMSGQDILINDKLAPKLSNLNICDLTPVIEPLEQEDKKILKYRITPRNGGLGNTEVYINGNLTYSLSPKQLKKTKEAGKEVYYLTLSTDSLQQYLTGKKNDKNPILVKSKVKGSGIYGRGEELEIAKTTDEEKPQFYGVFIGVNEYGNAQKTANETRYRNLDYAAKDANDLSLAVEKTAANLFQSDAHIYRLTGTGNEAPTKENLQRVLAEIGAKSKASDILYIFFAGHGDIKKGKNEEGQEQDQIRFMLMNADKTNPFSTSFGVEELTKWCSPQKIKAQKRVFVFDACHSGKIIDQTMAFNGRGDDEGARIRQLDKLKDKNGMMILAAAADDESAYEDETLNQGVLTYHLLQVMKEQSDTSLVVRNWFDETIELVKDYSKSNGNKQEPSSFGDGRFEIGNVNQDVREAIQITCPKTRVGACVFVAQGQAKLQYPNVKQRVNEYFALNGRGDQLVFSKNLDKAYRTEGLYLQIKDETLVTYDLYKGEALVKSGVEIPLKIYKSEDELVQSITNSIAAEIENLRIQDERCKLSQN